MTQPGQPGIEIGHKACDVHAGGRRQADQRCRPERVRYPRGVGVAPPEVAAAENGSNSRLRDRSARLRRGGGPPTPARDEAGEGGRRRPGSGAEPWVPKSQRAMGVADGMGVGKSTGSYDRGEEVIALGRISRRMPAAMLDLRVNPLSRTTSVAGKWCESKCSPLVGTRFTRPSKPPDCRSSQKQPLWTKSGYLLCMERRGFGTSSR